MANIKINNTNYEVPDGISVLEAARQNDIFIPTLCSHADLKPFHSLELSDKVFQGDKVFVNDSEQKSKHDFDKLEGCGLCVVHINGADIPVSSCETIVSDGMEVITDSDATKQKRQKNFIPTLAIHPHCCLTCSHREGCPMTEESCMFGNKQPEICCEISGNCEFQRISDFVGIAPETPKFTNPNAKRIYDAHLFMRDYNLCISCGRCVRACQQLRNVFALGAVMSEGKLVIGTVKGKYLTDADCRFCGACAEVCPTGAIQDIRKPRLHGKNDLVPCQANCPADVDIPDYLRLIKDGMPQASAEVIASKLSFPHSLGKMCFHPCETDCRRNDLSGTGSADSDSISIRQAKDYAMSNSNIIPEKSEINTGKTVAVIGAGPAGMTTAFYLALNGHQVTVYDKEKDAGGMLKYGIPNYRLSDETLDKDLNRIFYTGIKFKGNVEIGIDEKLDDLIKNNDAVYLATGLSKSRRLPIETPVSEKVLYGIEFLNKAMKEEYDGNYFNGKNIYVIGGGNVATDAARTAVRLGADNTTIICLESENNMPAYKQEIIEGKDEGIIIKNSWGISEINKAEDFIELNLQKCLTVFDENKNFTPKYDETQTELIKADVVIICVGQSIDSNFLNGFSSPEIEKSNLITVIRGFAETSVKGLFAGGDIVSGPASVIDAIGQSKRAAEEIDLFLGGKGQIRGTQSIDVKQEQLIGVINGFTDEKRVDLNLNPVAQRKSCFMPVEVPYSHEAAISEASRCLQCDLRLNISPNPHPPERDFLTFEKENIDNIEEKGGVVQLMKADKKVFLIKGSDDIHETLEGFLDDDVEADYFIFEYDELYTKKESELVQDYLQKYGEMPDTGDDLDDLF